jgi:hypothetical protein
VCPGSVWINPLGVPWSKRMSTGWNRLSAETLRHEVEHCGDLLAPHVELLDNLVDAEILEVLDHRGHGQPRAFEHPGTAHLAPDAFDGLARTRR